MHGLVSILGSWEAVLWQPILAQEGTIKELLESLALVLAHALGRGLVGLLGSTFPWLETRNEAGWPMSALLSGVLFLGVLVLVSRAVVRFLQRRKRREEERTAQKSWRAVLFEALIRPLVLVIWTGGVYFCLMPLLAWFEPQREPGWLRSVLDTGFNLGMFAAFLWLFFRGTAVLEKSAREWTAGTELKLDDVLVPLLIRSVRVMLPVIAIIFSIPLLGLPAGYESVVSTGSGLLIIGAVAWVLVQVVLQGEKLILARYDISKSDNLRARQVYTQVRVLKRTLLFLIFVFTVAMVLMSFEEVRRLGTSILASAGVVGVIIGFAAQKTIANLFAGFQLAMTQPIRLDDVVIVENEWGWIEDITLTYVVVRIWDLRRLIVPISYFIERPFQNWTRVSADILGTVYLHTDYAVPIEEVRRELGRVVGQSKHWDGKVAQVVVTDAKQSTMELRALVSAADSGKAWDLRCEVREKLLEFIQREYPQSLPRFRLALDGEVSPASRRTRERAVEDEEAGREPGANT